MHGKHKSFWRAKRGSKGPAPVNEKLQAIADNAKYSMPAARRLIGILQQYAPGVRLIAQLQRLSSYFTKSIIAHGKMDWSFFPGHEFNTSGRMQDLLRPPVTISREKDMCTVTIPLKPHMIETGRNRRITEFAFELIVISGDPAKENSLRTDSDASTEYAYPRRETANSKRPGTCRLSVQLPPRKPFIILLKLVCMEGKFDAGPKYMALAVLAATPEKPLK